MPMNNSGQYLYGFIEGGRPRSYKNSGLGGSPIYTLSFRDIAVVVSEVNNHEIIKVTPQNCFQHEKVLEEIIENNTILPFEFGTVSPAKEAVNTLLKDNYLKIKKSLNSLRDKAEMNVRAIWVNMDKIFQEIIAENRPIALYKKAIEKKSLQETYEDKIKIGQLVAQALYLKKEKERDAIITALKRSCLNYMPEKVIGDEMLLNTAFLIRKDRLKGFETTLLALGRKREGRINFTYSGPFPPYNFTELKLKVRG